MELLVLCGTHGAMLPLSDRAEQPERTQTGLWQEGAQEEALRLLPP